MDLTLAKEGLDKDKERFKYVGNGWISFGAVVVVYSLLAFLSDQYIFNEKFFHRSLSGQLTLQRIDALLEIQQKYWWLGYTLTPLVILLKASFATICIGVGVALSSISFKFKTIFKTALVAEVVFIIAQTIYMINLFIHADALTLATVADYFPLSALSYFGAANVVDWLQYPLQTLNLFEVAYIVVIAWFLAKHWKLNLMESLAVVVPSYVTGLVLWLAFVTFLTLQAS